VDVVKGSPGPETRTERSNDVGAEQRVEIRAEDLSKSFDERVVIKGVNLEITRGEIAAVVGASGSGKTVLLQMLIGLLDPTDGRVLVAHHGKPGAPLVDIAKLTAQEKDEVRLCWAVVFQRNALFSDTVYENCALWLREHTPLTSQQIRERVRECLEGVGLDVDDVIDKMRDELSGGMAKRVAVARAIAVDPTVIFYDEPTTGLDPIHAAQLHDLIGEMHRRPREDGVERTTVIVTHDRELLKRLEPRVLMIHEGQLAFDGPHEEFEKTKEGPAAEYSHAMAGLHSRAVT
jgi:phospholipid/cholesterol/gamma-HCH transport system ATP-binding protein